MGVPAFYRWLSEKYPKIVQDILEERVHLAPNSSTIRLPFDISKPNPSGLECDNLYIDMNGIIHPCSHPEQGPQPKCEEDMYENVCRYVDRLFRAARPRRMLFLAIDGVAPRAKMNQQRSRRFRSAQEMRENKELEEEIKANLIKAGHKFEGGSSSNAWDSNVITPGTKFMINLAEYVRFYIRKRISTDPAWKNIIVVFSDASIPGEGEHKIMNHIRHQRTLPDYNPNLVHVLHGLDADLIMLALATHEAHFYIMREEVLFGRKGAENAERQREESGFADAQQQFDEAAGVEAMSLLENRTKVLQRVCIPILREYLAIEFADLMKKLQHFKEVSFERLIDDVVFLCFFVGNDFLPHLPRYVCI
jgi:5'-3' exoribonuclease 2